VSLRLADSSPWILESMCSSFMTFSFAIVGVLRRLVLRTKTEYPGKLEHIVLYLDLIDIRDAAPRGFLLFHPSG
jgi:hypothetical protein